MPNRANLIILSKQPISIYTGQELFQLPERFFEDSKPVHNVDEFVTNKEREVFNLPIEKLIKYGRIHYIAVSPDIWEFLYYLDNPVTAKSQQEQIKQLKEMKSFYRIKAEQTTNWLVQVRNKCFTATLWQRIKWVFTGIQLT